jgi:hypothetical protein
MHWNIGPDSVGSPSLPINAASRIFGLAAIGRPVLAGPVSRRRGARVRDVPRCRKAGRIEGGRGPSNQQQRDARADQLRALPPQRRSNTGSVGARAQQLYRSRMCASKYFPFDGDAMNASNTNCGTRQKSYVRPARKRIFMRRVIGSYPAAAMARETTGIISMGVSLCFEKARVEATDSKRGVNPRHFCREAFIDALVGVGPRKPAIRSSSASVKARATASGKWAGTSGEGGLGNQPVTRIEGWRSIAMPKVSQLKCDLWMLNFDFSG